jgi:hypothetical protein
MWESVVADAVFNSKRELQRIDLYPITLGFGGSRPQRGRPLPAGGELATTIIDRVAKLSKPLGTNVTFLDDKGAVVVREKRPTPITAILPWRERKSYGGGRRSCRFEVPAGPLR